MNTQMMNTQLKVFCLRALNSMVSGEFELHLLFILLRVLIISFYPYVESGCKSFIYINMYLDKLDAS